MVNDFYNFYIDVIYYTIYGFIFYNHIRKNEIYKKPETLKGVNKG